MGKCITIRHIFRLCELGDIFHIYFKGSIQLNIRYLLTHFAVCKREKKKERKNNI